MGAAAAMLHWPPQQFWISTPHELYAAFEALNPKREGEPMTEEQLMEFMRAQADASK